MVLDSDIRNGVSPHCSERFGKFLLKNFFTMRQSEILKSGCQMGQFWRSFLVDVRNVAELVNKGSPL